MTTYLHEHRYYVDPHEQPVIVGDHVILSSLNIPWEVLKVARDGSAVYLRSLSGWGKRFGVESTARLKAAWRQENQESEIDWTPAYDNEEEVEDDTLF